MADKSRLHCFICDNKAGVSIRNSVTIFGDESPASESALPDLLQSMVNKPLNEDTIHSNIICKKCYKVVQEYDEMYTRMEEIKQEVLSEFKKTLAKHDLDYGSYGLISNSTLAQNKAQEHESPKITNLANIPLEKVNPLPPNVVTIHKGRKLAIQRRVNVEDIPNVGKTKDAETVEEKDEATLNEKNIKKEIDLLVIEDGGTEEAAQQLVESSAEESESAQVGTIRQTQESEEAPSPAQEAADDSLEKGDDRDEDYDSLDADEEMIVIKEGGDHDSLINAIKSATKGLLHSSGNQIMIRGEDGKEVALLISSSEGDEQCQKRPSNKDGEVEDAEGQGSTENTEQELQVSDDDSTRQIIRVTTKDGATYIKLEPGSDLSRALSGIEQKADSDEPIVERNGDLYTCILCANEENGDSEGRDSSDKVETGFVGVGGAISGHMKRVHGMRVHVCDVCGELLRRRSDYKTHLEKHMSEEKNVTGKL